MKPLHLWLLAAVVAFGTDPADAREPLAGWPQASLFRPLHDARDVFSDSGFMSGIDPGRITVRGQSPDNGGVPVPSDAGGVMPDASTYSFDGTVNGSVPGAEFGAPMLPETSTWNAFSPPMMPDAFAQPGGYGQPVPPNFGQPGPYGQAVPYAQPTPYAPYAPYGAAPPMSGGFTVPGANGPQPYRLGWQNRLNISWMPTTRVSGGATGGLEQFGVDYDLAHTGPCLPGWISTWTNQFRLRNWDGPVGGAGLPGDAYRFGVDYEVETPQTGPYSLSLGITPSINSDLNASVSSDAFQLDGRGIMFFQLDQYWTVGLGAQFWDRVNDRVIPYAGLVYRDDFWEWRLMFPESQISLFLGNEPYWSKWAYVRAEYHVEAYEISTATGTGRDEVELEDWRAMFGFRMDAGVYSWFIEAGWVFDREIDYSNAANASVFPGTGFLTQAGWRF